MNIRRFTPGVTATLLITVILPLAGSILARQYLPHWYWEHVPFHSAVETTGAVIALTLAALFRLRYQFERDPNPLIWVACAMVSMGVLDAFHASVETGIVFVWLRALATLSGGLFFALVWMPDRLTQTRLARAVPAVVAALVTIAGILSIAFPGRLPVMVEDGVFTFTAKTMNLLGGVFFTGTCFACWPTAWCWPTRSSISSACIRRFARRATNWESGSKSGPPNWPKPTKP